MTLDELAATMPWGFHDAEVDGLRIDYVRREVAIDLTVYLGVLPSGEASYRRGVLTLTGLHFCCVEPPSPDYPFREAGPITIDTGSVVGLDVPSAARLPGPLPEGTFTSWFFVYEWNAFIYIAASHAGLRWHDEW